MSGGNTGKYLQTSGLLPHLKALQVGIMIFFVVLRKSLLPSVKQFLQNNKNMNQLDKRKFLQNSSLLFLKSRTLADWLSIAAHIKIDVRPIFKIYF